MNPRQMLPCEHNIGATTCHTLELTFDYGLAQIQPRDARPSHGRC